MKTFPIMSNTMKNKSVPYDLVLKYEKQAITNHSQDIATLARRGGLGWSELACVFHGERLYSEFGNELHADEPKAYRLCQEFMAKHLVKNKVANPVEALRAVLALFPEDVGSDGSGRIGFKPEFVSAVENAREMLAHFDKAPAKMVWLNLEDGSFSRSWAPYENSVLSNESLANDPSCTGQPLYKLIEYRCLSDSEFEFIPSMKLR